jgi:hypothetical protein
MEKQAKIFEFFGSLPGLLVLAAAVLAIVLSVVLRRLRARRQARQAMRGGPAAEQGPPRWVEAAVAAYLALEERPHPSAAAWAPGAERADPWQIAAGQRAKIGVNK